MDAISATKHNRIERLCPVSRYPATYQAVLHSLPETLLTHLTASELAAVIDWGRAQHEHGYAQALDETL